MIKGIVCVDSNWGIGKNNDLLFHLKEDMKMFRESTTNEIVVMGENTLKSFPNSKPLKNRVNIVLAPEGHEYEGCIMYHNFEKLVNDIKLISKVHNVYIIGGAMMYKSMLPYYDEVIVTKVDADGEAEVFFPNLDKLNEFKCLNASEEIEDNNYKIRFCLYERID